MINMIKKECTNETIIYERIDNEVVNKCKALTGVASVIK